MDKSVLDKILKLPEELVEKIQEFLPREILLFTNRIHYNAYHFLLKPKIMEKNRYFSYIEHVVYKDCNFVFEKILQETKKYTPLKNSNGTPFEFSTKIPETIVTDAPKERPITNLQGYKIVSKKYRNGGIVFPNFYAYLNHYSLVHNSTQCRNVLNDFLTEIGLSQNRHKKNKHIHIRWKT